MTLRHGRTLAIVVLLVALGTASTAASLVAQDSTAAVPEPPADTTSTALAGPTGDSLAIRTSPMNAFWRVRPAIRLRRVLVVTGVILVVQPYWSLCVSS